MEHPSIPKDKLKINSAKSLTNSPSILGFPLPPPAHTSSL